MKLYLVQHGEATSEDVDPKRPLTKKGIQDVTKISHFLKTSGIRIDIIWHSVKTRAMETAQIIAKAVSPEGGIKQREGLAPNDPVKRIFDDILSAESDLMIVGHLPFLQKLASLALLNSESETIIGFRQGGIICLEGKKETGTWKLIFAIPPDLLQ